MENIFRAVKDLPLFKGISFYEFENAFRCLLAKSASEGTKSGTSWYSEVTTQTRTRRGLFVRGNGNTKCLSSTIVNGCHTKTALRNQVSRKTVYKWGTRYDGTIENLTI